MMFAVHEEPVGACSKVLREIVHLLYIYIILFAIISIFAILTWCLVTSYKGSADDRLLFNISSVPQDKQAETGCYAPTVTQILSATSLGANYWYFRCELFRRVIIHELRYIPRAGTGMETYITIPSEQWTYLMSILCNHLIRDNATEGV